jgi:hypothetical protein
MLINTTWQQTGTGEMCANHFNFALMRKFYGVFSTLKKKILRQANTSMTVLMRRFPSLAAAKLPPTSRFRAAATAAAAALLPPR